MKLLKIYNNHDLFSLLRCEKITSEDGFWTAIALFRSDALSKACLDRGGPTYTPATQDHK